MRRGGLWAIGLVTYVTVLLAQAPATLIDAVIGSKSNGRLRLAQAQGTVWKGAGRLEIRDVAGSNAIAKEVVWRVLPESIWRGRLVCEVELERAGRPYRVVASISKVEVADGEIMLPASALAFAEPRLKPLRLTGDVVMRLTNLTIARDGMLGIVSLQWRDAGSAFSPVSPIGSYELGLDGEGKAIHAKLVTLQGPLQLEGSGSWTIGGNPEFQATVRVPPEYREQLTPLLRLISIQRDEGSFEMRLR